MDDVVEITNIDKNLYKKYKDQILRAMQKSDYNLSRALTALLGPPEKKWTKENGHNGLIERVAHSSASDASSDDRKAAIRKLNDLLKLDPWLNGQINFSECEWGKHMMNDNFNEKYKEYLILDTKNINKIVPASETMEININNDDRLHIPPSSFYKQVNGEEAFRLAPLIQEIIKNNAPRQITIKGFNAGSDWECLYILSLQYSPGKVWGNEKHNTLKFPNSLHKWYFDDCCLNRYCDYYIVVDDSYCNINKDTEFQKITEDKTVMVRSEKQYEYSKDGNNRIEHILIFDNYQKKNEQRTANISGANTAGE